MTVVFALAKALDIDPKFVGFNGMLGVAFGSRGRSAAMAHYEPSNRVINLTKNSVLARLVMNFSMPMTISFLVR